MHYRIYKCQRDGPNHEIGLSLNISYPSILKKIIILGIFDNVLPTSLFSKVQMIVCQTILYLLVIPVLIDKLKRSPLGYVFSIIWLAWACLCREKEALNTRRIQKRLYKV